MDSADSLCTVILDKLQEKSIIVIFTWTNVKNIPEVSQELLRHVSSSSECGLKWSSRVSCYTDAGIPEDADDSSSLN
ncbi:hypothetical protein Tco_0396717 [Tanacetum coccineum]